MWDEAMKERANRDMAARADADQEYREARMALAKSRQQLALKNEGPSIFQSAGKELLCNKSQYRPFA